MKRFVTILSIVLMSSLFTLNVSYSQESKVERNVKKLNTLMKRQSFNVEKKNKRIHEWEAEYIFSFADDTLTIEYDEDTHFVTEDGEFTGRRYHKGKYSFALNGINPDSIKAINDQSNSMVNFRCKKSACVTNEYSIYDYDKDKQVKYKEENRKKKLSGVNVNVSMNYQQDVIQLLTEMLADESKE